MELQLWDAVYVYNSFWVGAVSICRPDIVLGRETHSVKRYISLTYIWWNAYRINRFLPLRSDSKASKECGQTKNRDGKTPRTTNIQPGPCIFLPLKRLFDKHQIAAGLTRTAYQRIRMRRSGVNSQQAHRSPGGTTTSVKIKTSQPIANKHFAKQTKIWNCPHPSNCKHDVKTYKRNQ